MENQITPVTLEMRIEQYDIIACGQTSRHKNYFYIAIGGLTLMIIGFLVIKNKERRNPKQA